MTFRTRSHKIRAAVAIAVIAASTLALSAQENPAIALAPSTMAKLGTVDPRFVSYNVEMVEVTGGRFWKPYKSAAEVEAAPKPPTSSDANQPVGMSASLYQYRPPINLANPRLRKLAEALGPSYVRVSGTWQNSTYFQNDDNPAPTEVPKGFKGVLTRAEWKGVIDFAHSVDGKLVTSFAISAGTRGPDGVWTPAQAQSFIDYTKSIGGSITAAEFMNEPTFPGPGGAPAGYDAAAFAKDAKVFEAFLRKESPQTIFLGPGGIGEGVSLTGGSGPMKITLIDTEDIMKATGPVFDAFSYHFYGTVSKRCLGNMSVDKALTAEWLDRTDIVEGFYANLRDKYMPGKPMWLNETAEAACGGDQFAGEFVDTFRYLNQLGTLAQKGVKVVMHNTLASSDYGLLSEDTLDPAPDYWAALLWKRTMGDVVLNPGTPKDQSLRIYAHCSKDGKGGVALVALNTDTKQDQVLNLPQAAESFTLTAADLTSAKTLLNGEELQPEADGSVGALKPDHVKAGLARLAPASVTFLIFPSARNKSCK
jgi:heparanase 1